MSLDLSRVRALLWDIDGTLYSSESILHETYRAGFELYRRRFGRPERTPELSEIMAQIGKPVREIFENLAPTLAPEERERLSLQILHALVVRVGEGAGEHYKGAATTLAELARRGYSFFSASNGRYPYVEAVLRSGGTLQWFSSIDFVDYRSIHNKTELVAATLRRNQLAPEEAAVIGDRYSDRDAAVENGAAFIACRYGHGAEAEWSGAAARVDSVNELLSLFPGVGGGRRPD
ncbi:MAG: HAD family hydrolase [Leptospirales bacterium]|nr:HAD family hydrolase [Leptospirales bacterium]